MLCPFVLNAAFGPGLKAFGSCTLALLVAGAHAWCIIHAQLTLASSVSLLPGSYPVSSVLCCQSIICCGLV